MRYENVLVEKKEEGIVKITLNRPQVLNALNNALCRELSQAFEEVNRDESVSVVILAGAGRAFCAGRDLKAPKDFLEGDWVVGEVFSWPQRLAPPIIAAVQGYAVTGGFELANACDLIVAAENAIFRDSHVQVGLVPGAGNTQRLPRLVGEKKAKEILFTSEFVSAREAERIGLVNKVVPVEKLEEETMALARKLASQPRQMLRKLKQVINEGMAMNFGAAMMFESLQSRAWRERQTPEEIAQRGQATIQKGRAEGRK
ncbi:MAG: enoyl-CoA hydratase-related protein [Chloroflexota bacterium]|nr:enoyl-CoA hydratase-related protein [Chloroflexota bacterium]